MSDTEEVSDEVVDLAIKVLVEWQGHKRPITYTVLARQIESRSDRRVRISLEHQMAPLLRTIGRLCDRMKLPRLPSLVVAQATGYPGNGYFVEFFSMLEDPTERLLAWASELKAVYAADYSRFRRQAALQCPVND